jgi:choline dehydrogenase-like flavoprotein
MSQMAEHYEAVLKFTGLSSRQDDLADIFPLYQTEPAALELSQQAKTLLARLKKNRDMLGRSGISFGQARVAIQTANSQRPGCLYCGVCMYGCPYGYIYNSESTLRNLQKSPLFSYRPDAIVTRLRETSSTVHIEGHQRDGGTFELDATRVYLAAGAISTTQILLRSQSLYNQTVWLQDSQYFLLPFALTRSVRGVRSESLHVLCQLFMEILDPEISPYTVHLQIYSYNDLISQAVGKALGPLAKPLGFLARNLEGRLLVIQGYLHSRHSSRIGVTLQNASPDRLALNANLNPETKPMIHRVIRKLFRHTHQIGAFPISPMLQIGEPGRGFHSGGSFPMNSTPTTMQSDTLGRPNGWNRVHAVDATVLPSIPATTITFSVMANAHRIGWESAAL